MMNGPRAFDLYHGLRLHFLNDNYHYAMKPRISFEAFSGKKDHFVYTKLAKQYQSEDDFILLVISNILRYDNIPYVRDLVTEEANATFFEFKKRIQSVSYYFGLDVDTILNNPIQLKDVATVIGGQHPALLILYHKKKINPETLVILDSISPLFDVWNTKITDDLIWPNIKRKLIKLKPFLNYDINSMTEILRAKLKEKDA